MTKIKTTPLFVLLTFEGTDESLADVYGIYSQEKIAIDAMEVYRSNNINNREITMLNRSLIERVLDE